MTSFCPVVELRQYTLYGGQRDTLIELFEREFVIPQERLGLRLLGQFRDLDDPSGAYRAMSLRCYDLQAARWSIWWVDARTMRLEPPVHGQFNDGLGIFQGEDTFAGKPILVRFLWSDITPDSARWEQAFSDDGGANWEPNWIMIFKRQDPKK